MNFGMVFEFFFQQMIWAAVEASGASIDEKNSIITFYRVTKFSKEWTIWAKTHFLVFVLFVGNFSNKYDYILPKNLRKFCFCYFCPNWFVPKLFVLKVDLCNKIVALVKITTVHQFHCLCSVNGVTMIMPYEESESAHQVVRYIYLSS